MSEIPRCKKLQSIEANGIVIPESNIVTSREALPDGTPAVRISTSLNVGPGLYVGDLIGDNDRKLAAAQLYISGARRLTGN